MSTREAIAQIKRLPAGARRRFLSQDKLRRLAASGTTKTALSRLARASAQTNTGQKATLKAYSRATILPSESPMNLIKSKQRTADHGEVFTPAWMVEAMLDLVKGESERIDSRFLEPACGSGNFLVKILQRKLASVETKFAKSDFEKKQYALLGLMCTYGIELLTDNIAECRSNMLEVFANYLNLEETDELYRAASYVLLQNLVHGDALTMLTHEGQPITFAEWGYLGKGKFQRRDFRFEALAQMSSFSQEGTLFAHLGKHEIFIPLKAYPPMTACELAYLAPNDGLE